MSAWLPTAPCTPQDCVERPAATVGHLRRVLRAVGCTGVLLAGIGLGPLVRGLPRRERERLVAAWARTLLGTLGVRVRNVGHGVPVPGGLLVANHVSWLDVALIAAVSPGRNLAKTEVGRWPVLGPLVARSGTLFIDRDRLRSLPGTVARIAQDLRHGERVVVFPEGSTWCGRAGGRFRPALFQAAIDAGVPVQPVALRYRVAGGPTTAPAFVGEDGLAFSLWRVLSLRGLVAEVVFAAPIPPEPPASAPPATPSPARRALARAAQAAVDRERDCGHTGGGPGPGVPGPDPLRQRPAARSDRTTTPAGPRPQPAGGSDRTATAVSR